MKHNEINEMLEYLKMTKDAFVTLEGMCKGVVENIDDCINYFELKKDFLIASAHCLDELIKKMDEVKE